jgi:hypothetical protein
MKRFAILLVACLVLAGCSGKDKDDEPTPTATASGSASSSSSSGSTGSVAPGSIAVVLNRTTPDGAAPLQVNFTLDATFTKGGSTVAAPGLASWNVTYVLLGNGTGSNGTGNATGNLTQGPEGTSLPANVTLNLTAAGNYSIVATVMAPGFTSGNASFVAAVFGGSAGGAPLFFDGGETDTSQWTLTSNVYINTNIDPMIPSEELPEDHPSGSWEIVDSDFHDGAHAWGNAYPDNYRARMTSVPVTIPAGGATLSYWIKGGAEDNAVDGIHVLAGPADALVEVAHHSGLIADWTQFTVALAAGETVLEFRMDSDISCSNDGPPNGSICGAGYDGGGLLLDDITVA